MSPYVINDQERIYQLALLLIKGVGFSVWEKLIKKFMSAKDVYENSSDAFANVYKHTYQPIIKAIHKKDTLSHAEDIIKSQKKMGIKVISFFDTDYPERLRNIKNPPCFLYCKGNFDFSFPKVASIVGTRHATANGKLIVKNLVEKLSEYGVMVVSGLAYGIDICAHEIALQQKLPTVAVLPNSLDTIYPSTHTKIALKMLDNGGLVSEITTRTVLESFHFPNRNRIIAGLADTTIVVEAGTKSGSLITANFANNYNRKVFAFPGNIYDPFSAGCNQLIRNQKAHLVTKVDEIACIMNWGKNKNSNNVNHSLDTLKPQFAGLNEIGKKIVYILQVSSPKIIDIDELCQKTQLSLMEVSPMLLQLEIGNIVESYPGNKYKLRSSM
jgi:DNA processing protein